ncbi:hypothetical protein LOK49_LG06G02793 [Camellia lanceoleosa]|uniref:Uncharacterized protein n=1 Tax=Camellia lanceoleosa TaxID=1840588 RepID=A0ACC0HFW8_9ERIC|nr:hypothetical protein LOK49_LG06G02793 [Camellia lanceoleosa]
MKLLHFYGVAYRARSYSRGRRYFYWHCDCNCCSCKYQTDLEGHAGAVLMPNRYSGATSWSYWQHPKQVTPGNST